MEKKIALMKRTGEGSSGSSTIYLAGG